MHIETHISPADDYLPAMGRVVGTLPASGRTVSVDVTGPRTRFGQPTTPEVNWPGIGAVTTADAAAFAELLVVAARVAAELPGAER